MSTYSQTLYKVNKNKKWQWWNKLRSIPGISVQKGLILILEVYHWGPKPNWNRFHLLYTLFISLKNVFIQSIRSGCKLYLFSLRNYFLCGTLSNAFSKPVYNTSMRPPCSNFSVQSSKTFKSCWTVERPLMNPYCLLLNNLLLKKNSTMWSRIMDSSNLQHIHVGL